MKNVIKIIAVSAVLFLSTAARAQYTYDASYNRIMVSGASCRAADGNAEWNLYHYPGSTSVIPGVAAQRIYCPLNRRNMHAYSKQMSGFGFDVAVTNVWVRVNSPSMNLQCRLFGKDFYSKQFLYSPWTKSTGAPWIYFSWHQTWTTVNWGIMCDVPAGEAVLNIEAWVSNNNSPF